MEGFVKRWQRNAPTAVLGLIALSVASFSSAAVLSVEDFGAVGDGKQNDSPAVVKAIDALRSSDTLEFSAGKTYRLGRRKDSTFQIDLQGMTNVTVDGNGAMLLNNPWRASIRMQHCDGVTVRNFEIEQDPLGYTQGIVTKISPDEAFFEMKIMDGYDLLPTGVSRWDWGSIIDPNLRRIREGMSDHFRSEKIEPLGGRNYRVIVQKNFAKTLAGVRIGDIYFQPFIYNGYASNIHITNSKDCLLENVTLYSGRSSMSSRVDLNTGRITLRGFKVLVKPGTDRVVSNWRDGVHCKDNRIGPIIENCVFERMLDDSINLSQNTLMASEVISDTTFRLTKAEGPKHWTRDSSSVWKGDELMVFYPQSGEYIGPIKVVHVDEDSPEIITLESPVTNVVTGTIRSGVDRNATHFYNLNMCNSGFIVRDNKFLPQRRHAVLVRSPNGLIEGNTIEEVGGHGVVLENEYGHFYEGPFPQNVIIRNNIIQNTHLAPVCVQTHSGSPTCRLVKNIEIACNIITSKEPAVELNHVENVTIKKDNQFLKTDGGRMLFPVQQEDSKNIFYVSPTANTNLLDGGFEIKFPDSDNNGFELQLNGTPWSSPWKFKGTAGCSLALTAFTSGNPVPPEGAQVLVLKGRGRVSQELTLEAGTYTLSFYAAQRKNFGKQIQQFRASLGDTVIGNFQPPCDGEYKYYERTCSLPLRNTYIFDLQGLCEGDETVFVDGITLVRKGDEYAYGGRSG